MPETQLVTAQQLAESIPLPASYFLRLARRKEIPHYRVGRRILFHQEEVLAAFTHIRPGGGNPNQHNTQ